MNLDYIGYGIAALVAVPVLARLHGRWLLSRAKHRSLAGHSRIARLVARLVPYYAYDDARFFACDDAPAEIAADRRRGFERLGAHFSATSPESVRFARALEADVADVLFTSCYRVPYQFRGRVRERLPLGNAVAETSGTRIRDIDGNWAYDVGGSYGVNVLGYDVYKDCIDEAVERMRALGPVLGPYHPVIADNVDRLKRISGLDGVSFHMSGTEAVMQAVRLARFHTGRSHIVQFCGAYHGWWDGVQPGIGNPRPSKDVYVLEDMSERTLRVLDRRRDVACVLVNPVQSMHPNSAAPGDGMLVDSGRRAAYDRDAYAAWLAALRDVCSRRSIVLILDEVFTGFRLARGGAQELFGVRADVVTYGKTLGGGLPVGVVCGRRALMKRFRDDRPTDICFARGTFNSHPYVMGAMNAFLTRLDDPALASAYADAPALWDARAARLNERLAGRGLPLRVANLVSVWSFVYTQPSRYNWMLQFYLRAEGLALGWVGTGRLIFSHDYTDADYAEVADRIVAAADRMQRDGWWWHGAGATNGSIRRRILREMIGVRTGSGAGPAAGAVSARTAARRTARPRASDR